MRITFTVGTLIAGIAVLTMAVISAGRASSEPKVDPIVWIIQYENDAAAADVAGDISFYQKNLTDDWSDGMSNGQFQTKKELISDQGYSRLLTGERLGRLQHLLGPRH